MHHQADDRQQHTDQVHTVTAGTQPRCRMLLDLVWHLMHDIALGPPLVTTQLLAVRLPLGELLNRCSVLCVGSLAGFGPFSDLWGQLAANHTSL